MGPDWELLAAALAKDEAHKKKQRMKQGIKNKKLEDKSKIQKVWMEDECGPTKPKANQVQGQPSSMVRASSWHPVKWPL